MKIHFWGVRGSIPTPGPQTVRYGGNTPCVSLELDANHTLILDAGTGLFRLGKHFAGKAHTFFLLLSHLHWDHIQGFPMFRPHMNPEVVIRVLCPMNPEWSGLFLAQMDGVRFPIYREELLADVDGYSGDPNALLERFGVSVEWLRLNHRGECYGYRLTTGSKTVCYVTDHEMDATADVYTSFDELASFCTNASVLIHDAAFTNDQMPAKATMGHSTMERVCELATAAGVQELILFHHEPDRSDDMLDGITAAANEYLSALGGGIHCRAAFEGLEIDL